MGGLCNILLVEDNPGDARLMLEALKEAELNALQLGDLHQTWSRSGRIHVVEDGVKAMAFMRRKGEFAKAPRPDLILLDLNLPRKNGREVLAELKQDPELRFIPVIVLSTSNADQDVTTAYDLHANCFVAKPLDFDQFSNAIQGLYDFWCNVVRLPS